MGLIPEGWDVIVQDESIFFYDIIIRKVWAIKGSKPQVKITGSHKKTFLFGSLSLNGRQLFRQYSEMNYKIYIEYLKCLKRKFKRFFFYHDGAPWHRKKEVLNFFEANKECIIPIRFPKYSPKFNPTEECWRQSKKDILGSIFPPLFEDFKKNISQYFRTKRFNLDIVNYLCR